MRKAVSNFSVSVLLICGGLPGAIAQDIPLADETLNMSEYKLVHNQELGVPAARIGEKLYQMKVTLIELPPGGKIPPQRHMADEVIYIVSGEGQTTMWLREGDNKVTYSWGEGDMLSPTLNAWHQHINTSPDTPARYLVVSSEPVVLTMFHDPDFISNNNYVFEERWKKNLKQNPEYTPVGTVGAEIVRMRIGHHITDLPTRDMRARREGVLGITIRPEGDMAGSHIMEWEVREYQSPDSVSPMHRHPWEVVYFAMSGEGYADLQRDGEPKRRVNWKAGELFFVEANEYHELRPRNNSSPRFIQIKASGMFYKVGNMLVEPGLRLAK